MEEITLDKFEDEIKNCSAVIQFSGPGCTNCRMQEAIMDQLGTLYPEIKFFKLDITKAPDLARKHNVSTLPTVIFIKDNTLVDELIGLKPKPIVQKKLDEYFL